MNTNTKQAVDKQPETKADHKADAKPEVKAQDTKPKDTQVKPQDKALTEQENINGALELMREMSDELPSASLREFRTWIDKVLKEREVGEIAKARAQILAIAQSVGVPVDELLKIGKGKTATLPGIPVPPKYIHPEHPELTWSGRGRQPKWVADWLAAHNGEDTGIRVK